MADGILEVGNEGLSNLVSFNRSWRADTATDNSPADAITDNTMKKRCIAFSSRPLI